MEKEKKNNKFKILFIILIFLIIIILCFYKKNILKFFSNEANISLKINDTSNLEITPELVIPDNIVQNGGINNYLNILKKFR